MLDSKFGKDQSIFLYAASTILDPRFKKRNFKNFNNVGKACAILHKEILQCKGAMNLPEASRKAAEEEAEFMEDPLWKHQYELEDNQATSAPDVVSDDQRDSDFTAYLQRPTVARSVDPIAYWIAREPECPALARVALKYVTVTCTSVACERLFSEAGNALGDKSSRLTPDHLFMRLFMKSMDDEFWF